MPRKKKGLSSSWLEDNKWQRECLHDDLFIMCALCGAVALSLPQKPGGIETGASGRVVRVSWEG